MNPDSSARSVENPHESNIFGQSVIKPHDALIGMRGLLILTLWAAKRKRIRRASSQLNHWVAEVLAVIRRNFRGEFPGIAVGVG